MARCVCMADRTQVAFSSGTIVGVALVVLGVGAWFVTDFASMTALIPAILGILVVGAASLGKESDRDTQALYALAVLGAVGVLGSLRAVPDFVSVATGEEVDSIVGVGSQAVMILLGLVLVIVAARALLADR